jgi:hypothetical protein
MKYIKYFNEINEVNNALLRDIPEPITAEFLQWLYDNKDNWIELQSHCPQVEWVEELERYKDGGRVMLYTITYKDDNFDIVVYDNEEGTQEFDLEKTMKLYSIPPDKTF